MYIYVVNRDERWAVRHNGEFAGPFVTQQTAINEAVAVCAGDDGADSDVQPESADERLRTEWAYGDDLQRSPAD